MAVAAVVPDRRRVPVIQVVEAVAVAFANASLVRLRRVMPTRLALEALEARRAPRPESQEMRAWSS